MGIITSLALAKAAVHAVEKVTAAGKAVYRGKKFKKRVAHVLHPQREDVITMRKSTFIAVLVFLSAVAGALAAAYVYLQRREAELDEYEQLLFSEDFSHETPAQPATAATPATLAQPAVADNAPQA